MYSIHYFNLPNLNGDGGYEYGPPPASPARAGVGAVSATHLHLLYAYAQTPDWFRLIKSQKPEAILGGSIYLFKVDPGKEKRNER